MDVVNGKIVETARAAGRERTMMGVKDRRSTADHHHQAWSGLRPSRRLFAGAWPDAVRLLQQGPENSAEWAAGWTRSSIPVGDDTRSTSPLQLGAAVPISFAAAAPRWYHHQPPQRMWERDGRAEAAAHYFTGLLNHHRQGWKRTELRVSDEENGKVVEPATDHGPQPLGSKFSRLPLPDTSSACDQLPRSSGPAASAEWAPPRWTSSWASVWSSNEPMSSSFGTAPGDGALAAPRRLVSDAADPSGAEQGSLQPDSRQGWNWSRTGLPSSPTELSSPRWGLDQRRYHFNSSPCLEGKLDEEMTVFESQLTRTVSGYFSNRTPVTRPRSPEISPHVKETSAPVPADAGDDAASFVEKKPPELVTVDSSVLKRKRSDLPDGDVQRECGWTQPLKLLIRKGLTVSDAGELGRIILPKKDAESLSFPQIDTKEGTMLEMEDYMASKRWYFRFKYWINNKSRMYVLENTGDFIRYHCLKEHDVFVIYEGDCKKLVVRGLKMESGDPMLELSKGSMVESSTSQAPVSTTDDERCCNVTSTVSCNCPVPRNHAIESV